MPKKRDIIDDLVDLQNDWKAISNPVGSIANALTAEPQERPVWTPSQYKERPRGNSISCVSCTTRNPATCTKCLEVCPVEDAITINGGAITVGESCRKCGLCVGVCPTESFITIKHTAKRLYDQIAGIAVSHDECYVTCTRALGRIPEENEVVLPCVGLISSDLWTALLVDYPNISVYLPLGICDRCKTTTGEEVLSQNIGDAEEWGGHAVGLEVDEKSLDHARKREWERREFMENIVKTGTRAIGGTNKVVNAAQVITTVLDQHSKKLDKLEATLTKACGATANQRHRILTHRRELMLGAIQKQPDIAPKIGARMPACDTTRCTMCGECMTICPVHAVELDDGGHFSVEPAYCVDCGACLSVCEPGALTMVACEPEDLVVPDTRTPEEIEREQREREEVEKAKAQGKATLDKGLEFLGKLGGDADDGDGAAELPPARKASSKKPAAKNPADAKKPATKKK